tara:strand:+ start:87756 stop:88739 length:984 start_codon:yes stop_codon:yes gene_type:complete
MSYQVYRTNSSSYQDTEFFNREKNDLENVEEVKYIKSLTELDDQSPFILLSNTHTVPEELPEVLLDNTVLMIHPNSGHENIPKNFVQKVDFPIILGNPIRSHAVVEYIMSCLFHHFTPMTNQQYWSHDRKWERGLLRDQKVLIIGHGNIGKIVFQTLKPLCSSVEVVDPYIEESHFNKWVHKDFSNIDLSQKSIVIVAASLTSTSRGLINSEFLKKIPQDATLINPARGEIINETDLITHLQKNERFFAFLDVFEKEPFNPGHMFEIKNVNKTSHIAGVYSELNNDIIKFEKYIIEKFVHYHQQGKIDAFKAEFTDFLLKESSINYF